MRARLRFGRLAALALAGALAAVVVACGGSDGAATGADADAGADRGASGGAAAATSTSRPATTTTTAHAHSGSGGEAHQHGGTVTLPRALPVRADGLIDPDGVDLSGVEGVTPEQQARAEELLVRTIRTLPRWADVADAVADGFQSIGDSLTGEEHYLHWDWIEDDVVLDPEQPESLVYRVEPDGGRTLEAAMFMLPQEYTFDDLPDVGGPMTQWHIHDDLCFTEATPDLGPQVASLTSSGGACPSPLVKFHPNVMMHVWIRPNECGPFASLLGVGAGQVAPGAERSCVRDERELSL